MSAFGYGRERMKKLHVDAILYKNIRGTDAAKPGPGSHDISLEWTVPTDISISKTTPQYSFSKCRKDSKEHFNMQMNKNSCLPGPGEYATPIDVPILSKGANRRYNRTAVQGRRATTQARMSCNAEDSLFGPSE